jgi:hypothetical protein
MSKKKEDAVKTLGHAPKSQPAPKTSNNPGETVSVGHYSGDSSQVTTDEATDGHYESVNGQPKWVSSKAQEGRVAPEKMNDHVEPEPNDRAFPNRIEVEDGTTLGRHTK